MLDHTQIDEAAAVLRGTWQHTIEGKGGYCTVCSRWGKINVMPLTGAMVKALAWLHREQMTTGERWVNVPERAPRYVMRSYAISTLKHWNLVVQRYVPPPTKEEIKEGAQRKTKTSGMWQITVLGVAFLMEQVKMHKKVFVYNDTRMGAADELVSARECFEKEFNYDEMMGATYNGTQPDEDEDELDNN